MDEVLRTKKIWPFPSKHDGEDSGWQERVALCKANKYQIWQSKKKEEKGAEWTLFNGNYNDKFVFIYKLIIIFRR